LSAAGRLRSVVSVNLATAGVSVVAGFILIPPLGALGAAISCSLTLLVQNGLLQLALRRTMGIPLFYRPAVEAYAVIGGAAAILLVLESMVSQLWIGMGLVVLASMVVFLLTHRALRIDDMFPEIRELSVGLLRAADRRLRAR
jgi:O-antigen/teichoic acid export membrane protein